MRYRTAAILSIVLIVGMFVLQNGAYAVAVRLDRSQPVPFYLQVFFHIALFVGSYKFLLAPAILIVLFLVAAFTKDRE